MQCFEGLAKDDDVRVIVVTGGGDKAFSAGADIREITAPQVPTIFREARRRLDFRRAMDGCWQPIIAAIRGHCFGGGLELALACDIRLATPESTFALPEVRLGILPGGGGTQRLAKVAGMGVAMRMILTGDTFDASFALNHGLVTELVPKAGLEAAALKIARQIAGNGPLAVIAARRAVLASHDLTLEAGLFEESALQRLLLRSRDAREGATAFVERRPAAYIGS
jgi:enoyl-CoA hydratase/carnithine racemase